MNVQQFVQCTTQLNCIALEVTQFVWLLIVTFSLGFFCALSLAIKVQKKREEAICKRFNRKLELMKKENKRAIKRAKLEEREAIAASLLEKW